MEAHDALNIAFVSRESSAVLNIPYSVEDDKSVTWHHDLSLTSPLSKEDPTEVYQGDMIELFYVMSHIENSPFTVVQLVNYYNVKGFDYRISEGAIVDKVKIEMNRDENPN
jgi:hypothetical protein